MEAGTVPRTGEEEGTDPRTGSTRMGLDAASSSALRGDASGSAKHPMGADFPSALRALLAPALAVWSAYPTLAVCTRRRGT